MMGKKQWKATRYNPETGEAIDASWTQHDYIQPGSEEHAGLLGIRKVSPGEKTLFEYEGFTFLNPAPFTGPFITKEYVSQTLRGAVDEFKAGAPSLPLNAPRMWRP